jgi:hypothetical protein
VNCGGQVGAGVAEHGPARLTHFARARQMALPTAPPAPARARTGKVLARLCRVTHGIWRPACTCLPATPRDTRTCHERHLVLEAEEGVQILVHLICGAVFAIHCIAARPPCS